MAVLRRKFQFSHEEVTRFSTRKEDSVANLGYLKTQEVQEPMVLTTTGCLQIGGWWTISSPCPWTSYGKKSWLWLRKTGLQEVRWDSSDDLDWWLVRYFQLQPGFPGDATDSIGYQQNCCRAASMTLYELRIARKNGACTYVWVAEGHAHRMGVMSNAR